MQGDRVVASGQEGRGVDQRREVLVGRADLGELDVRRLDPDHAERGGRGAQLRLAQRADPAEQAGCGHGQSADRFASLRPTAPPTLDSGWRRRHRTPERDFSLDAELDETTGWDLDDSTDGGWESGYADEPDPEEADPTTGAMDLAERHVLRRVAGLSTELEDISEVEYRQLRLEQVVLVGVWTDGTVADAENSMAELALLAETAGSEVLDAIYQRRAKPDPATYIGRGKVDGLREIVHATGADTVICDGELAPSQLRNLEDRSRSRSSTGPR